MARKRAPEPPQMVSDLTPLIDIVFLLIIFFMTVTELTKLDKIAGIQLPIADQAYVPEIPDPDKLVINIERVDGSKPQFYIRNVLVDGVEGLVPYLHVAAERKREAKAGKAGPAPSSQAVVIRADKNIKFMYIQDVMQKCADEKLYKVSLVAKQVL